MLALLPFLSFCQITPDINSGDPRFPFPQFLAYDNTDVSLGNLDIQVAL